MEKYIGKYRVACERDLRDNKPINNGENTYIKCRHKAEIYRYNNEVLVLYVPSKKRAISYEKVLFPVCFRSEYSDYEGKLYFYEKDIEVVAEVCKPYIKGKDIKPRNKRSYNNKNVGEK